MRTDLEMAVSRFHEHGYQVVRVEMRHGKRSASITHSCGPDEDPDVVVQELETILRGGKPTRHLHEPWHKKLRESCHPDKWAAP